LDDYSTTVEQYQAGELSLQKDFSVHLSASAFMHLRWVFRGQRFCSRFYLTSPETADWP